MTLLYNNKAAVPTLPVGVPPWFRRLAAYAIR